MSESNGLPTAEYISADDYIIIIQDGCLKKLPYGVFIKDVVYGGVSICQLWLDCVVGIGNFEDMNTPPDTPPTMGDVSVSIDNRKQNYYFNKEQFIEQYYDADGDVFAKIRITGGDLTGVFYNENPVTIGLEITADELLKLKYNARNQDPLYTQVILFEAFDNNNVKAQ